MSKADAGAGTVTAQVEGPDALQRRLSELTRQADAATQLGDRTAWIGYATSFIALPFVVVLFRLHMQAWHYYLAGGLFLLGAVATHAIELAAMTRHDQAMRALECAQAACGTSHARPEPSDIAIQMQDEVAPAGAGTAEARTPLS